MTLSVADLFTAQTKDQIRAEMVTDLVSLGVPADKWKAGGVASTMLTVCAMSIAALSLLIAGLIQGFFLPTATGAGLKLLAKYMYGVDVPTATFASGNVTLTNAGGASFNIPSQGYTCQNPTTKVTYTNDAPFTLGPNASVTINVIATVAGSAGNAIAGAVNTNVTVLLGVTVSNATALVGIDAPTDAAIRNLCLDKLAINSARGVRRVYSYAVQTAVNAVTGAPVNINRWVVSSASHTGDVVVRLASPSGAPDSNDVLGVVNNIEALARPEGITVLVFGATPIADNDTLTVWCRLPDGVSSDTAKTAVDAALLTFISAYPIGGEVANDDAHPVSTFEGLFAQAVYGVIGEALSGLGGSLVSAKGANDLALGSNNVATDGIGTTIRVLANTSGTTVG